MISYAVCTSEKTMPPNKVQTFCHIVMAEILLFWFDILYFKTPMVDKFCHFYSLVSIEDLAQRPHWQVGSNPSTPTGVWSHHTRHSAAPVMMLCCHAIQITTRFPGIQPHCICGSQNKNICNNSYSILHCSKLYIARQISAITEMQCTFTCCQSVAQVHERLHINKGKLMLC